MREISRKILRKNHSIQQYEHVKILHENTKKRTDVEESSNTKLQFLGKSKTNLSHRAKSEYSTIRSSANFRG